MSENKEKKTIWFYAVILFTSAFIVLLLTAYSQTKFNKNLKNQYETNKQQLLDLNSARELNKKLNQELDTVKKQLDDQKKNNASINSENNALKEKLLQTTNSYEFLSQAEEFYNKGDKINCATILVTKVQEDLLGTEGTKKFEYLKNKTYGYSSLKLFGEGYSLYMKNEFQTAIDKFELALKMNPENYFKDDCLFFGAKCYIAMNQTDLAKSNLDRLLKECENSNYAGEAQKLIESL